MVEMTYVDAIKNAIQEEMRTDEEVFMVGQDIRAFRFLAKTNQDGMPTIAVMVQSGLALVFVLTATFDQVLVFAGFTLALNSLLAVAGLFVLRQRQPDLARPFRVPLFPFVPLVYLALTLWTLIYVAIERPQEVAVSALLIVTGVVMYVASRGDGPAPD